MDLLIIKITQESISRFKGKDDKIYQAVRSAWRLNVNRAETVDYVLAAKEGKIVGVFKATKWHPCENRQGRYEFEGNGAPEDVCKKFLKKSLPLHFSKQGASNPIIYATEFDFGVTFENNQTNSSKESNDPQKYTINAVISSIDFESKAFGIKGCDGFCIKSENGKLFNLLKAKENILTRPAEDNIQSYDGKMDLWGVISNAFDSKHALKFTMLLGGEDGDVLILKSISKIED